MGGAPLACMTRLAFEVALVGLVSAFAGGAGCGSTSPNPGAADGSVIGEDGAPTETAACTDANVQLIQASNYDQSCTTNSDCIAVGEGNACYPCEIACPSAAINASAKGKYLSDVAKTSAGDLTGVDCGCPAAFNPCCRGGTCYADFQCQNPTPVGDEACAAAGGVCVSGGCSKPGLQACGKAGMFCCLIGLPHADVSADASGE